MPTPVSDAASSESGVIAYSNRSLCRRSRVCLRPNLSAELSRPMKRVVRAKQEHPEDSRVMFPPHQNGAAMLCFCSNMGPFGLRLLQAGFVIRMSRCRCLSENKLHGRSLAGDHAALANAINHNIRRGVVAPPHDNTGNTGRVLLSNKQRINHRVMCAVLTALSASSATAVHAAAAEETASEGLEEITVTAQRRSESIQNVPITIQAIQVHSSPALGAHFRRRHQAAAERDPGSNGPGQGTIYMRGLSVGYAGSQSSASINPFPNVATYLDDQSLTFPGRSLDIYMVDMERIEVLEGPQGTLFGGGAEAGAVRYITNKPKLNNTEGSAEAGYSWTAHGDPNTSVTGVLNVPLIADTACSPRGVLQRAAGWLHRQCP